MAESRSHKIASNRIAEKYGVDYNSQKGIDINSPRAAIEVETESTVQGGLTQLQGHRKPAYIAGANQAAVERALGAPIQGIGKHLQPHPPSSRNIHLIYMVQ